MNKHLQRILEILQQENLTAGEKSAAIKALKDANKELEITAFKLDKTEKVKHTTAILLQETARPAPPGSPESARSSSRSDP